MSRFSYSLIMPRHLSLLERWVHLGLWLVGLFILNWPGQEFTIGVFSSRDHELMIPSLYGTFINAAIVYGVINLIMDHDKQMDFKLFLQTLLVYLLSCGIESMVDAGYYFVLTTEMSWEIIWEIALGSMIMNFFFFYVPALIYGIVKSSANATGFERFKIEVQDGHNRVLISPNDLSHVESYGNYVKFHAATGVFVERSSLINVERRLPPTFIRCHKSFIINQEAIEKINAAFVEVRGYKIPVGRKYKQNLLSEL